MTDGVSLCRGVDKFDIPIDFPIEVDGTWMTLTPNFEYFVITTRNPPPPLKHGQRFCKRKPRAVIRPLTYYTEYEGLRKQIIDKINDLEARKKEVAEELQVIKWKYVVPTEEIKRKQDEWYRERLGHLTNLRDTRVITEDEFRERAEDLVRTIRIPPIGIDEGYFLTKDVYLDYLREKANIVREKLIPLERDLLMQWDLVVELDAKYVPIETD